MRLVYESGAGGLTHFELGETQTIRTAKGASLDAYPLISKGREDSDRATIVWLDANLLLVRYDTACWGRGAENCTHKTLSWRLEGLPWILGLDTGLSLASGEPAMYKSWGMDVDASPTVSRTKTHTVASFPARTDDDAIWIPFSGVMRFAHGSIHPDNVNVRLGEATVPTELRLVSADMWARTNLAEPTTEHLDVEIATSPTPGRLFVDEGEDTFGIGHSHASLMDRFFAEFEEAARMLSSGGCLIDYSLWPAERPGALASLDEHVIASMQIRVLGQDGQGKRWEVDVNDGPFGVSFRITEEDGFTKTWTCADVNDLPLPALTIHDFLDGANRDVKTHIGLYGVQVVREPMPFGAAGVPLPELFGTRFTAYFEPETGQDVGLGIAKSPYYYGMHAEAERLLDVLIHPSDVDNFA